MEVLLTGGSGFLGSHIAEQLSQSGHRVRAIVRSTSDTTFLSKLDRVKIMPIAMTNHEALKEAVKGVDAIIHSAALVKARTEDEFMRVNVGYTENLLDAAEHSKDSLKRFVLVSSVAACGPSTGDNTLEGIHKYPPVTRYGKSKLAAERVAQSRSGQIPITIVRPVSIYGSRDKGVLIFFKLVKKGIIPNPSSLDRKVLVVHGSDCARACIQAISAKVPSGAAYLVDDGNVYTWREIFAEMGSLMGRESIRWTISPSGMNFVAGVLDFVGHLTNSSFMLSRDKMKELSSEFVFDSKESHHALSWKPEISIREGMKLTLDWYRAKGWI